MIEKFDSMEIYCPQLGMMMTFNYCRQVQSPFPCRNLIGCWEKRLAVGDFLVNNYSIPDLELTFGGLPKSRLERIFDCIRQTQETNPNG